MGSSHRPGPATLDLVRIICGDPTRTGPGFHEIEIPSSLPPTIELREQLLVQGSYGEIDLSGLTLMRRLVIDVHVRPTQPFLDQTLLSIEGSLGTVVALQTRRQRFSLALGEERTELSPHELVANRWYRIRVDVDFESGVIDALVECLTSRSPGRDLLEVMRPSKTQSTTTLTAPGELKRCLFAASPDGERFDGRLARPEIQIDDLELQWDLAQDISGRQIVDTSANKRHGSLYQLPARGVTGPGWDGSHHTWTSNPQHYDAVHFHRDDLYDAGWPVSAELKLKEDLPSGIYAFRLRSAEEVDRVPFFVRPAVAAPTADVALLMSSCTYIAYANHRMLFEGADFVAARSRLRPEHEYLRRHPEVGPSLYEKHSDGSGVMYSSRRRPNLQLRPGADGWNFTPDTDINAFMDHLAIGHDIIADEDLHAEGFAALEPYRVIVTGSHPEYWSTAMLDALERWVRGGGRLMYLLSLDQISVSFQRGS